MALASWTTQQILDQLISGYSWSGSTITYAFPTSSGGIYGSTEKTGFQTLNATQQSYAKMALATWDDLIAPTFVQTTSTSSNIEFGMSTTGVQYAHTYYPTVGSVWFNSGYADLTSPQVGRHGFLTYVHELGHALGLDHMGNYNGSGTWTPSSYEDSTVYSVMSYFGPSWGSGQGAGEGLVAWADWVGADGRLYSPQTPMLNDILAVQTIYGADTTTRTGDTVYGFGANVTGPTSAIFDFSVNRNPILTVFDAGGNDTLNLSGWSTSSTVNLAPGSFSSCNSMTNNIAIAYSTNIENAICGAGADSISGNTLANGLDGGAGNDLLYGLGGNDALTGGSGNDYIDGGAGDDWAFFSGTIDSYTVTYNAGSQSFTLTGTLTGIDTVLGVEYFGFAGNVTRTAAELSGASQGVTLNGDANANTLTGTAWDDTLNGLAGNDTLDGGGGNDLLDGGSGIDQLNGGAGNDTYVVDSSSDLVTEALGAGTDQVLTSVTYTLASNIENLTLTGSASVNGTGNGLANVLVGNAGNNVLSGGAGLDSFRGGLGNDTYVLDQEGELAAITEASDAGTDGVQINYSNSSTTARVVDLGTASLGAIEKVTVYGSGLFNVQGNGLNNVLVGNGAANRLEGGAGNDNLDGKGGADVLVGGLGNDTFFIDTVGDSVVEYASQGTDTVRVGITTAGTSYTLSADVENGLITSSVGVNLVGNDAANTLTGNGAANSLDGRGGNDVLIGGAGRDFLTGGAGGDIFDFNALSEMGTTSANWDVVADFAVGLDRVDLSTLDANTASAGNDAFGAVILGASAAFTVAGQLKFAGGVLYGNTDADSDAEFAIQLTNVTALASSDLVL